MLALGHKSKFFFGFTLLFDLVKLFYESHFYNLKTDSVEGSNSTTGELVTRLSGKKNTQEFIRATKQQQGDGDDCSTAAPSSSHAVVKMAAQ